MLQLDQLSTKLIINEQLITELRKAAQTDYNANTEQSSFLNALDSLMNQHLRGLDFKVKRVVKAQLIENHLKAESVKDMTYYDVAKVILAVDMPTKQVITNFQNWILMSTEFTLPYEEVIRVCLKEEFIHAEEWANELTELVTPVILETVEPSKVFEQTESFEEPIIEPVEPLMSTSTIKKKYRIRFGMIAVYLMGLTVFGLSGILFKNAVEPKEISFKDACVLLSAADDKPRELEIIVNSTTAHYSAGFPSYLGFEPVNKERLKGYLKRRNSLLAEEPYFSTIIEAAAIEDVHPALLFAITGQEQGFVKRGSENAALIVNNPFNVYHSWIEYNTNLSDASRIAAQTIRASLADRPEGENPFLWLNKTYAEDKNWWQGTEHLFLSIEAYIGPYHFESETEIK